MRSKNEPGCLGRFVQEVGGKAARSEVMSVLFPFLSAGQAASWGWLVLVSRGPGSVSSCRQAGALLVESREIMQSLQPSYSIFLLSTCLKSVWQV